MPIHIIGTGQNKDDISTAALHIIHSADVLVGTEASLAFFADHKAKTMKITTPLGPLIECIAKESAKGLSVVVLAGGDPLFYSIGNTILQNIKNKDITVCPGISSLQKAAAKIKIPWQDIHPVSLHGRKNMAPLYSALLQSKWVCVLTDGIFTPACIARSILKKSRNTHTMWVLEDLGGEKENMHCLPLEEVVSKEFHPYNLVLLKQCRPSEIPLRLGTCDSLYLYEKQVITKAPVRAVSIAALRIEPDSIVWDIGAGSGSVGIEASTLCIRGEVWAVEKNPVRFAMLEKNIARTGALVVEAVQGKVPDCLDQLPDPDCIFIGGGLQKNPDILRKVYSRLLPGGRLVVNAVLLDTLQNTRETLSALGLEYNITLVQAAQSHAIANTIAMQAANPVYIISATK